MSSNLNFKLERQAIIQILHWASGANLELAFCSFAAPTGNFGVIGFCEISYSYSSGSPAKNGFQQNYCVHSDFSHTICFPKVADEKFK